MLIYTFTHYIQVDLEFHKTQSSGLRAVGLTTCSFSNSIYGQNNKIERTDIRREIGGIGILW